MHFSGHTAKCNLLIISSYFNSNVATSTILLHLPHLFMQVSDNQYMLLIKCGNRIAGTHPEPRRTSPRTTQDLTRTTQDLTRTAQELTRTAQECTNTTPVTHQYHANTAPIPHQTSNWIAYTQKDICRPGFFLCSCVPFRRCLESCLHFHRI